MQSKAHVRNEALAFRASLEPHEIAERSLMAFTQLQNTVDWPNIHSLHVYPSRHDWHELDTAPLIDFIRQNHTHIRVEQPEPKATTPLPDTVFDLIIVPVVAYDSHNYRLGVGSGWYDKFLATQPNAISVGFAFKETHKASLPKEQHDVPLTKIIAV